MKYVTTKTNFFNIIVLWVVGCLIWGCSINAKITAVTGGSTSDTDLKNLGSFSVDGVTGSSDITLDANLNSTTYPTISWGASTDADYYEAIIYANDGVTVVCPAQTTTSPGLNFSSCSLTPGQNYKAEVWARLQGSSSKLKSVNGPFAFYVNSAPTAANDTVTMMYNGAAFVGDPIANSGVDSDPDGDTLTITNVSTPSKGVVSISSATQISYTPNGTAWGADSFTYTVSDGHGGTSTATVNVKLMTPYTWMGLVDATWSGANWCGSIASPGFSGTCAGGTGPTSATNTAHIAVFNGFCTTNCSPTISAAATMYSLDVDTTYSGTITQAAGAGNTIVVGYGGFWFRGGSFAGGTGNITVGSTSVLCTNSNYCFSVTTPGTFTSTSAILKVRTGSMTITPGTFNHNSGTFTIDNQFISGATPQALTVDSNHHYNIVNVSGSTQPVYLQFGTMNIDGDFTINRSASTARVGYGTINLIGNLNLTTCNTPNQIDLTINMVGVNQTITGSSCAIGHLNSNLSGTLTLSGTISLRGNYIVNSGTVVATGSTLEFSSNSISNGDTQISISPGTFTYNHVNFLGNAAKVSLGGNTLYVGGDLTLGDLSSNSNQYMNTGTIDVAGNINVINTGVCNGNYQIIMSGVNQTISGGTGGCIRKLTANSSGTLTLTGIVNFMDSYIFNAGALSAAGSTVNFGSWGGSTLTVTPGTGNYANVTFDVGPSQVFNFTGTSFNILGDLTVTVSSGNSYINNAAIQLYGNLNVTTGGNMDGSASTIRMIGAGRTITQFAGRRIPAGVLYIGDGVTATSVTALTNVVLNDSYQDLTVTSSGTLNMAGFNLTVSDGSGTNNVLTVDSGGTINMGGGTHTQESLSNSGTINP